MKKIRSPNWLKLSVEAYPDDPAGVLKLIARLREGGRSKDAGYWADWAVERFPTDAAVLAEALEAAAERRAFSKAADFAGQAAQGRSDQHAGPPAPERHEDRPCAQEDAPGPRRPRDEGAGRGGASPAPRQSRWRPDDRARPCRGKGRPVREWLVPGARRRRCCWAEGFPRGCAPCWKAARWA